MRRLTLTKAGRQAAIAAKLYLEMRGYKVLELQWRRPLGEVDIIALKEGVVYFVLVNMANESFTPGQFKVQQALAEAWVEENKWPGGYSQAVVNIDKSSMGVLSFIDQV